jgi:protein-disulfide isomerase
MPETHASKRDYSALYLPGAIIIAGVLIAGGLYMGLSSGTVAQGGKAPQPKTVNVKDVKTDGVPFLGSADAPLTMAFWSDFQCPFCKAVEVGGVQGIPTAASIPDIIKKYVDTGKLRIVFKDFVFLGQDSITAAEYEHAVWDLFPDKYFTWRTEMYKAQDEEGDQGFGDAASIDALNKKLGLDAAKIKARVAEKKADYDALIQAETAEGQSFGIQGTPGFIIGTKAIDGAQPLSSFTAAIDSQLK